MPLPEHRVFQGDSPDPTYYHRMFRVERDHWWHKGMREISAALLGARLKRPIRRLLDVGCGTGGFLRWVLDLGVCQEVHGIDVTLFALGHARRAVPTASLELARLEQLPFKDASFDLVVVNDVLQHVSREEVRRGLREIRRVLEQDGTLLVRTNGARRGWALHGDVWRVYDRLGLVRMIEEAGFRCERVTYANLVGSLWGVVKRSQPKGPTAEGIGIPEPASPFVNWVGSLLLSLEAWYLARSGRTFPYGHTLFAVATPGQPRQENRTA